MYHSWVKTSRAVWSHHTFLLTLSKVSFACVEVVTRSLNDYTLCPAAPQLLTETNLDLNERIYCVKPKCQDLSVIITSIIYSNQYSFSIIDIHDVGG